MILKYVGKNVEVTDALKDVAAKLSRLDKYFPKDIEGNVTFSTEKSKDYRGHHKSTWHHN